MGCVYYTGCPLCHGILWSPSEHEPGNASVESNGWQHVIPKTRSIQKIPYRTHEFNYIFHSLHRGHAWHFQYTETNTLPYFSPHCHVETYTGVHTAAYPNWNQSFFSLEKPAGAWYWPLTLDLRFRMRGVSRHAFSASSAWALYYEMQLRLCASHWTIYSLFKLYKIAN